MKRRSIFGLIGACTLLALGARGAAVLHHLPFYSSDTAILDLMTRHFVRGEWSPYYWGENYYGVLDQVLLLPCFALFGQSPVVSQALAVVLTVPFLVGAYLLFQRSLTSWALLNVLVLLALPPLAVVQCSSGTYNYPIGLVLCLLHILWWRRASDEHAASKPLFAAGGVLAGLSWYYFHFVVFVWMAIGLRYLWTVKREWLRRRARGKEFFHDATAAVRRLAELEGSRLPLAARRVLVALHYLNMVILLLAAVLWIHGDFIRMVGHTKVKVFFWDTAQLGIKIAIGITLVGYYDRVFALGRTFWRERSRRHFLMGFLIGYLPAIAGMWVGRPPHTPGRVVALPELATNFRVFFGQILPFYFNMPSVAWRCGISMLVFGMGVAGSFLYLMQKEPPNRRDEGIRTLVLAGWVNLVLVLVAFPLVDQWEARYFLLFFLILPVGVVFLLGFLRPAFRWTIGAAILVPFLAANALNLRDVALVARAPQVDQTIVDQMLAENLKAGYADYWIAYRVTAVAHEQVVLAPTGDNDRYPPYLQAAQAQEKTVLLAQRPITEGSVYRVKGLTYQVGRSDLVGGLWFIRLRRT